jgi:hypothetical protein
MLGSQDLFCYSPELRRSNVQSLNGAFLLASSQHFYPCHPLTKKIFPSRDSCDEREVLLENHAVGNVLSMVKYTLENKGPRPASFSIPTGKEARDLVTREAWTQSGLAKGSIDSRLRCDWMEALFYHCKMGNIVEDFDKIVKYLEDEYFHPVKPKSNESNHGCWPAGEESKNDYGNVDESDKTVFDDDYEKRFESWEGEKEQGEMHIEYTNVDEEMQMEYENIMRAEEEAEVKKRKQKNATNEARTSCVLETVRLMKEQIKETHRTDQKRYEERTEALDQNLLYSLDAFDRILEENENSDNIDVECGHVSDATSLAHNAPSDSKLSWYDVEELIIATETRVGVLLELAALEYVSSSCETVYVNVKFFVLVTIGSEANVAHYVGRLSDPKKYKNFPLYLRLLLKELEDVPFNVHNVHSLIKSFVNDASLFYMNGIVKPGIAVAFYGHSDYARN